LTAATTTSSAHGSGALAVLATSMKGAPFKVETSGVPPEVVVTQPYTKWLTPAVNGFAAIWRRSQPAATD
jgi:hypothetical protein